MNTRTALFLVFTVYKLRKIPAVSYTFSDILTPFKLNTSSDITDITFVLSYKEGYYIKFVNDLHMEMTFTHKNELRVY